MLRKFHINKALTKIRVIQEFAYTTIAWFIQFKLYRCISCLEFEDQKSQNLRNNNKGHLTATSHKDKVDYIYFVFIFSPSLLFYAYVLKTKHLIDLLINMHCFRGLAQQLKFKKTKMKTKKRKAWKLPAQRKSAHHEDLPLLGQHR